jgi:hypothetical protein
MLPIVKEILESLRTAPGKWDIIERDAFVEARHQSGIHLDLYSFGCDKSSTITVADGGSLRVGFWDKRRLWKALRATVIDTLKARAEARLNAHKYCPFCGKEIKEKS